MKKYKLTVCSICGPLKREPIATDKQGVTMIEDYLNNPQTINISINKVNRRCCSRCISKFLDQYIGQISHQIIEE